MKFSKKYLKQIVLAMVALTILGAIAYAASGSVSRVTGSIRSSIVTGSAALDFELTALRPVEIREARLHIDAVSGTAEAFVIQLDSGKGSGYDVIYMPAATTVTAAALDYWLVFSPPIILSEADSLQINWANTNTNTYGFELIYEEK